ncbi:MAG: hypothetical protein V7720_04640 [Halioglobus sp.]
MAEKDYSEKGFHAFLRHSALSGLLNPSTARARKTAAEQLLVELKSEERADMRMVDVDELCLRFHKMQGSTIRSESMEVYRTRLKDALVDFISWTNEPGSFKPSESEVRTTRENLKKDSPGEAKAREQLVLDPPRRPHEIFPVPLRDDVVVYIQNVPLDMTPKEAQKIAAVVCALADPDLGD